MYRTCLIDEGHEDPTNVEILIGNQFTIVKRFLMSLDQYRFGDLVKKYRNGDRDWPVQVSISFQQCEIHHNSNVRSQIISSTNRRGAFVANVAHVNQSAPTTVKCESVCRNDLSSNRA